MKVYITQPAKIVRVRLIIGVSLIVLGVALTIILIDPDDPAFDKFRPWLMGMIGSGFLVLLYNQLVNSNKRVGYIIFYRDAIAICKNEITENIYYKTIDHIIFQISGYDGELEEAGYGGLSSALTFKPADKNKMIIRTKEGQRIETSFFLGSKSSMLRLRNRWRKIRDKQGIKVVLRLNR